MKNEIRENRLKVFIENARLVSMDEVSTLPVEKRESVTGKKGIWIEVQCPEGSCSIDKDKIVLPAGGVIPKESKGLWLSLFCPENQCELKEYTDLP